MVCNVVGQQQFGLAIIVGLEDSGHDITDELPILKAKLFEPPSFAGREQITLKQISGSFVGGFFDL
jgi:hypothetical protein